MREADRREVYFLAALSPERAVAMTAALSAAALTGVDGDGVPFVIFGVCRRSALSEVGVPWLLATDDVDKHNRIFARRSREFYQRVESVFPVMENWALAENVKTLRWLKWLGFDMQEPRPYGAFGQPFVRFGKGLDRCA